MTDVVGFLGFLVLTLALLGGVFFTGFKARRKQHLPLVAAAVASLLTTIYYAEQLGEQYDLESAGMIYPVHLFFAKSTTVAYLAPIVSGFLTLRRPSVRRTHRYIAFTVLLLTVVTAVTGAAMVYLSDPIPSV